MGSSGIIGTQPPFPSSFSFTFPNAGTFDYQCRIHDHMVGLVVVR
jgi:plastocyanin